MGSYFRMHIGGDEEENMLLLRSENIKYENRKGNVNSKIVLGCKKKRKIGLVLITLNNINKSN